MLKVLFISSGNAREGISTIIKNQGESLRKTGIDIHYFSIKGKGFGSYVKHIFILRKYLKSNRYDVFHAHYSTSAFTATLAGCKPLVVSLMGSDTKTGLISKSIIRLFSVFRWRALIVKSSSMKKDLRLKRAVIIPNGVDLDLVKPSTNISGKSTGKILLFAADPDKYVKNYKLAKEAVELLNGEQIKLKVIHARAHEEIIEEINNADVLLLTSLWEGSPNIIKEAMACNCPVVSTNVGDVQWLFGDEPGYFLTSFDPKDVAEKIIKVLTFTEEKKRTNGRARIIKLGLDTESIASRIIDVYQSILK